MSYSLEFYNRKDTFEDYLEVERRRQVILSSNKCEHATILDIGTGLRPYHNDISGWSEYVIVDPNKEFTDAVSDNISVINSTLEESNLYHKYDFIILSSVLHLVKDLDRFLSKVKELCHNDTLIHINVPNARSLHRLLGYHMGLLDNIYDKSEKDIEYEHTSNFIAEDLIYVLNNNGFWIECEKTYMLKPLSDEQMSQVINKDMAAGLCELAYDFDEYGCEIMVEAKCIKN